MNGSITLHSPNSAPTSRAQPIGERRKEPKISIVDWLKAIFGIGGSDTSPTNTSTSVYQNKTATSHTLGPRGTPVVPTANGTPTSHSSTPSAISSPTNDGNATEIDIPGKPQHVCADFPQKNSTLGFLATIGVITCAVLPIMLLGCIMRKCLRRPGLLRGGRRYSEAYDHNGQEYIFDVRDLVGDFNESMRSPVSYQPVENHSRYECTDLERRVSPRAPKLFDKQK
ncbi:hypothetical protein TWF281_006173 [Arthrobotrys megalospora]